MAETSIADIYSGDWVDSQLKAGERQLGFRKLSQKSLKISKVYVHNNVRVDRSREVSPEAATDQMRQSDVVVVAAVVVRAGQTDTTGLRGS